MLQLFPPLLWAEEGREPQVLSERYGANHVKTSGFEKGQGSRAVNGVPHPPCPFASLRLFVFAREPLLLLTLKMSMMIPRKVSSGG